MNVAGQLSDCCRAAQGSSVNVAGQLMIVAGQLLQGSSEVVAGQLSECCRAAQ